MKMVAASKLRQAQNRAESARPYANHIMMLMLRLIESMNNRGKHTPLIRGKSIVKKKLFIIVSGERGLCGGFNAQLLKQSRRIINTQRFDGKEIKIISMGRKGYEALKSDFKDIIVEHHPLILDPVLIKNIVSKLCDDFEQGLYDEVHVIYNQFKNALNQIPHETQLIPCKITENMFEKFYRQEKMFEEKNGTGSLGWYLFKPDAKTLLEQIIPQQIATKLFQIMLETAAGEQAARMTAMDNATSNAKDMINDLTIEYNRERQAVITREITEIVSGAEAL